MKNYLKEAVFIIIACILLAACADDGAIDDTDGGMPDSGETMPENFTI